MDVIVRGPEDVRAAGALVARALRQSSDAVFRLRGDTSPAGEPRLQLAAWLPYEVLVTRTIDLARAADGVDRTVSGSDLLQSLERMRAGLGPLNLDAIRGAWWPGAWPTARSWTTREFVASEVVADRAREAARVLRGAEQSGPGVTQQAGTAMLKQTVLTVTDAEGEVALPLSVLLASSRMGFVAGDPVRVATAPGWIRLDATYGSCLVRDGAALLLQPL